MKRSRYTERQVVFIPKQAEMGTSVAKLEKLVADLSLDKVTLQEAL